ncbi:MAG: hypothetical protein MZV64_44355 [Ignavibacteriales bacterium]|nr:hypothetical protein [Ignavibacteriales bacterium]
MQQNANGVGRAGSERGERQRQQPGVRILDQRQHAEAHQHERHRVEASSSPPPGHRAAGAASRSAPGRSEAGRCWASVTSSATASAPRWATVRRTRSPGLGAEERSVSLC